MVVNIIFWFFFSMPTMHVGYPKGYFKDNVFTEDVDFLSHAKSPPPPSSPSWPMAPLIIHSVILAPTLWSHPDSAFSRTTPNPMPGFLISVMSLNSLYRLYHPQSVSPTCPWYCPGLLQAPSSLAPTPLDGTQLGPSWKFSLYLSSPSCTHTGTLSAVYLELPFGYLIGVSNFLGFVINRLMLPPPKMSSFNFVHVTLPKLVQMVPRMAKEILQASLSEGSRAGEIVLDYQSEPDVYNRKAPYHKQRGPKSEEAMWWLKITFVFEMFLSILFLAVVYLLLTSHSVGFLLVCFSPVLEPPFTLPGCTSLLELSVFPFIFLNTVSREMCPHLESLVAYFCCLLFLLVSGASTILWWACFLLGFS